MIARWLSSSFVAAGPLVNQRTGGIVATDVDIAADRRARNRGLLGRDHLPTTAALVLVPCFAIHTWRMRFPIDVLFVDSQGQVVKTRERMPAWRVAAAPGAYAVIELAAGQIARTGTQKGDELRRV
jgi:uncharacterized membrane protein (UPF0127 family)